jgi:hypothetical protein
MGVPLQWQQVAALPQVTAPHAPPVQAPEVQV